MTIADTPTTASDSQHLVIEQVSWELYERLVDELGEQHIRMSYDDGRLELMSPLPKHEGWGEWIGNLVFLMCLERRINVVSLGSTTFKNRLKKKGLEPDKCYYVQHAEDVRDMEDEFDPAIHPE